MGMLSISMFSRVYVYVNYENAKYIGERNGLKL